MPSASTICLLKLKDDHGADLAEFFFYREHNMLYVRWHGHLTGAQLIRGIQQSAQWSNQLPYSLILNDKTDTSGDWSDALPWLQYEWLPQALQAGVRAMAYLFSPDRENQFASHDFIATIRPHLAIQQFDELETAMAWLITQKSSPQPSAPDAGDSAS